MVATVLLLVTFGFVYSMVLFKSNMAFEFEDAANAEEMAAAFGKGEGGLEEAGGLMSRLSFWLANWINEFAADYVSGNQMMTIVMSGAISCFRWPPFRAAQDHGLMTSLSALLPLEL